MPPMDDPAGVSASRLVEQSGTPMVVSEADAVEAAPRVPVEDDAIGHVRQRLIDRFPSLKRGRIQQVVAEEFARFEGAPVRVYVPALVEHAADARLRLEGEVDRSHDDDPGGPVIAPHEPTDLDPMQVEHRRREQRAGFLSVTLAAGPSDSNATDVDRARTHQ